MTWGPGIGPPPDGCAGPAPPGPTTQAGFVSNPCSRRTVDGQNPGLTPREVTGVRNAFRPSRVGVVTVSVSILVSTNTRGSGPRSSGRNVGKHSNRLGPMDGLMPTTSFFWEGATESGSPHNGWFPFGFVLKPTKRRFTQTKRSPPLVSSGPSRHGSKP